MSKNNGKVSMTVTIDADVLKRIDEERGELIPRSRYVDYLLKKQLIIMRKERKEADYEGG